MDQPRTVRVTVTYRDTLTEGVGGWSTTVTLAPGTTLTVRSVRVTLDSKAAKHGTTGHHLAFDLTTIFLKII